MADDEVTFQFRTQAWLDGIKLIGAGNSAGLFGAAVAIYYFGNKPPPIPAYIKALAFTYFGGVILFTIAIMVLTKYVSDAYALQNVEADDLHGQRQYKPRLPFIRRAATIFTVLAFAVWLLASFASMFVIWLL